VTSGEIGQAVQVAPPSPARNTRSAQRRKLALEVFFTGNAMQITVAQRLSMLPLARWRERGWGEGNGRAHSSPHPLAKEIRHFLARNRRREGFQQPIAQLRAGVEASCQPTAVCGGAG